ncbi:MAG: alcohol dehydrogenase catalytic domain-containing protein [Actinomycetota bacterium]|nr:alcohol dehydrogenase catalytic domain-containing protein [Actinomycetota bacterium]
MESVPIPEPAPHEALVAVTWVGLCGSDVEEYLHGPLVIRPPVTLGHEIVGVVAARAADGSGPAEGTRVVVDVVNGCGRCFWCQRHQEGSCADLLVTGQQIDGGLADFVVGRAERLIAVPDNVDMRTAALAEPLAVAVRAVRKAGSLQGRGILLVGGGTIGMLSAQVAQAAGAGPVVVVEPSRARRDVIETWGAATVWDSDPAGRRHAIERLFPGRGVDVVVECAGRPGMIGEAALLARRGGIIILTGVLAEPEPVNTLDLVLGEKTVLGSSAHMWDDDVAVAVQLLRDGRVDVGRLVTHTIPLASVDRAFDILTEASENTIKVLVQVSDEQVR